MEPGVPFALLGSVQLLAVAAWAGLACAALALTRRTPGSRVPALLAALGAVVLVAVEVRTGLSFGSAASDDLALARCAGALLLGAGLYAGALPSSPARSAERPVAPVLGALPLAGIVVPLGAAPGPSVLAAGASLAAALAAVRAVGGKAGAALGGGLALAAAAAVVAPIADDGPSQAVTATALRGAGAVLVLTALVVLARTSLLAKVVAAILAGVLAMAAAAVGVVGTVVTSRFDEQAASLVEQAAQGRLQALTATGESAVPVGRVAQAAYARSASAADVTGILASLSNRGDTFAGVVDRTRKATAVGGSSPLTPAETLSLGQDRAVRFALETTGPEAVLQPLTLLTRLAGAQPSLALVVLVPETRASADVRPASVFVFGQRLGDAYAADDFDAGGYGLSLLVGDDVVASNRSGAEADQLEAIASRTGLSSGIDTDGVTVQAEGKSPTVRFVPLQGFDGEPVGVLALSRRADESLAAQRDALRVLMLTALLTTALVGVVAVVLGRRTVDPVRRLTDAAERIGAGDLAATAGVTGDDEVAALSRTFDAMTGNLGRLTDDLRDSAARLATVLASMSDGMVATDGTGTVTSVNRAAVEMAGLPDEAAALGRSLVDVLDVRDPAGEQLADARLRLRDAPGEVHPVDGGPTVPVRIAITPLQSGDGVVVVLRDTTREREVERMKTEFLSNVSHELRTPLTPIRGYADILVSRGAALRPEQVATFSATILAESLKMNRVVDLLVDVASIEAGRVQVSPRPVAVRALLDERLVAWRGRAPERAGDLRRRVAGSLPHVLVDPTWVAKALDELLDNAVKYTPVGTPIALVGAMSPDGRSVRVSVKDSGPGIAERDQALLFTSFEQVDGSATRRVGGLGLGLSFVRRLADDAGFPLTVVSSTGKGAEFALDLPVTDQPPPAPTRRAVRKPAPPVVPAAAPAKKAPAKKAPAKKPPR
ncbi:MAG: ATP-binding protein [Mycobacteriales bacterium]|nr:ATP-binding protein [Mycobacteriales bacterium]